MISFPSWSVLPAGKTCQPGKPTSTLACRHAETRWHAGIPARRQQTACFQHGSSIVPTCFQHTLVKHDRSGQWGDQRGDPLAIFRIDSASHPRAFQTRKMRCTHEHALAGTSTHEHERAKHALTRAGTSAHKQTRAQTNQTRTHGPGQARREHTGARTSTHDHERGKHGHTSAHGPREAHTSTNEQSTRTHELGRAHTSTHKQRRPQTN